MEYVTLNNGVKMPMIGFGVFQVNDQKQCQQAVEDAIEVGYRSIDTAASYMNEEAVGAAVRNCGVKREELFITTKLWVQDHEYDDTLRAFDTSMAKLGLDYLDLWLIHKPYGNYYAAWRAMERLYKEGRIRAIGVTSFSNDRLIDLVLHNEVDIFHTLVLLCYLDCPYYSHLELFLQWDFLFLFLLDSFDYHYNFSY